MEIAIIGFQKSGKTTIFNALTGSHASTSAFAIGKGENHIAVVKVPDERVDKLAEILHPRKTTHASVKYIDLVGISKELVEHKEGLGEQQMLAIGLADALLAVLRGFTDAAGTPPDPSGDLEALLLELVLSDLTRVDARLPKLEKSVAKVTGREKENLQHELAALIKIKPALEKGTPLRAIEMSDEEEKAVRGFQFLTAKPLMVLVNIDEQTLSAKKDVTEPLKPLCPHPGTMFTQLCGQTEMEIAELPPEERAEFLASYGITEPAADRIIRLCYELLGYISFLTGGEPEVRSWPLRKGLSAQQAAGVVHSDFERGFIRAEVVSYDDFMQAGSLAAARKNATLHVEGKHYVVQDGDVIHFLFNV
ncbi:MAG: DUF933 domain-containing protein, partial [bacterium]